MSTQADWNRAAIEEFRTRGGKVGGYFEGKTLLLLHTVGAKSGQERVNPVVYAKDGDKMVIAASKGGYPKNPDWYYNLLAHPLVTVEVGTEKYQVRAEAITTEPERSRLYQKLVDVMPSFADYVTKTSRVIPVVILTRVK